jgi:hypothetical protein
MTGLSVDDVNRLILAAAGVPEGGSLGPALKEISPGDFQRGYITAGHSAESPAKRKIAQPVAPEGGGRSASLCTTPPDDGRPGEDSSGVEKVAPGDFRVVEPEAFHRGPILADHEAPSPGGRPANSPAPPATGSGHQRYADGVAAYEANQQRARADHVMPSQACAARPVPAQYSPPAGLGARNVPQPRAAGATRKAPGE